jgi:exodeoxyribonuclease VII large subunit
VLSPLAHLHRQAEFLRGLTRRLHAWWGLARVQRRERLKVLAEKLGALSPLAILARGYSICWSLPSRHIVKAAAEVQVGSEVAVRLHAGELRCLVQEAASGTQAE